MKIILILLLGGQVLLGDVSKTNKLEQAVLAKEKIHEVNKSAAKPGERPQDYASPGRAKHDKPPPPGKIKHDVKWNESVSKNP